MSSYRIVIVEDQREVSRLLHSALDTLEYKLEIVEIPSGEEAILDSSRNPIDLLVSDYRLPGISGIELMRKVRKYRPKVKVILITGHSDPRIRKSVADAGADAFFIKPVPIADFLGFCGTSSGAGGDHPSARTHRPERGCQNPAHLAGSTGPSAPGIWKRLPYFC